MERYRAAVEGRIRTSARGVVETEEVLRQNLHKGDCGSLATPSWG